MIHISYTYFKLDLWDEIWVLQSLSYGYDSLNAWNLLTSINSAMKMNGAWFNWQTYHIWYDKCLLRTQHNTNENHTKQKWMQVKVSENKNKNKIFTWMRGEGNGLITKRQSN